MQVLRAVLRSPRVNELAPGREFWDAPQLLKELHGGSYFSTGDDASTPAFPPALQVRATDSSAQLLGSCRSCCSEGGY